MNEKIYFTNHDRLPKPIPIKIRQDLDKINVI